MAKQSFMFKNGQTIVFFGDSITDCGRRDHAYPFGSGYVRRVIELIQARYPNRQLNFFNEGISGDTSVKLRDRFTDDVLVHQPDWLSVLIGINDIHNILGSSAGIDGALDIYGKAYDEVLARTQKETKARVILMDPFYISQDYQSGSGRAKVLAVLPKYIKIVQSLARKYKAIHIPLHDIFRKQLKYYPADMLCPEPVHPKAAGHMVIAEALLSAVGW